MKKEFLYLAAAVAVGHFFGSDFEVVSSLVFGVITGVAAFIVNKFIKQYKK